MSDIKLFRISSALAVELDGRSLALEKSLQSLIEHHLDSLLGVRFLATEYATGKVHRGRIDTLGVDENGCPVIIEYKRASNENVINQGLFYLDWLMDHKAEFELLVLKTFGQKDSESIEWSTPRLLCIAGDFSKYDQHAVQQMNRNIELIRYVRYGEDLLLLELVNATTQSGARTGHSAPASTPSLPGAPTSKNITEIMVAAPESLRNLYDSLRALLMGMGDDVQERTLKWYIAFTRLRSFACVEFRNREQQLVIYARVDPSTVPLEEGFTRDLRNIGHSAPGNLEIRIRSQQDIEKARPLLERSYEGS